MIDDDTNYVPTPTPDSTLALLEIALKKAFTDFCYVNCSTVGETFIFSGSIKHSSKHAKAKKDFLLSYAVESIPK